MVIYYLISEIYYGVFLKLANLDKKPIYLLKLYLVIIVRNSAHCAFYSQSVA